MLSMFKRAATRNESLPFSHELKLLFFLAGTVFVSISLLTYSAHDHSWFYFDTQTQGTTNVCGYVGACVAGLCYYLFGTAALLLVCIGFFLLYMLLLKKELHEEWDRLTAYAILLGVVSTWCAVHNISWISGSCPGGFFGYLLKGCCFTLFDRVGTYILLYTLLCACLVVITRFSFIGFFKKILSRISFKHSIAMMLYPFTYVTKRTYKPAKSIAKKSQQWLYRFYKNCTQSQQKMPNSQMQDTTGDIVNDEFWKEFSKKEMVAEQVSHDASIENEPEVSTIETEQTIESHDHLLEQLAHYELPKLDMFIGVDEEHNDHALMQELEKRAIVLQEKLERFGVFGKVTAIKRGPVVTMFEYQPQIDTKISKIIALEDDLALALQATSIRIIAPIPGKSVVGFEVANKHRRGVMLCHLIKSDTYKDATASLPMILGVDTIGSPVIIDLARMPHLLMAGSTGSGKSVALNAMLISLLCKVSPDDLRLVLIDPKRLEFAPFADIAHLLFPIVTDPKQSPSVLRWVVKQMEERYEIMAKAGARNIHDYRGMSEKNNTERMPFIVVVIDELADLMMCAGKEVEDSIIRITQMARAAGIHLISATQRPSVDVITGLIKVNFPSRISFRVTSKIDSRTILDCAGADKLLGKGDMLFLDANDSLLKRVHGAYVLDKEINQVIAHIRSQRAPDYLDLKQVCEQDRVNIDEQQDAMYDEICGFLKEIDEVSISLLQRRFRIGYNRSARIIDMLEAHGLIAPSYGGKTRKVNR